jgi:hypothetical protein
MEITVATELSSTTITNILEAVPGIKTVLRSPAADAMVNLTRAAAGIGVFDTKDARELMRFAFRRGLINSDEHDRVLVEVEGAARARHDRLAARKAARDDKKRKTARPSAGKAKHRQQKGAKVRAAKRLSARPRHAKPKAGKPKHRPAAQRRPLSRGTKAAKKGRPSSKYGAKVAKAKKAKRRG